MLGGDVGKGVVLRWWSCRAVVVLFSRDEAALLCGLASEVRIKLAESCRRKVRHQDRMAGANHQLERAKQRQKRVRACAIGKVAGIARASTLTAP